MEMIIIIILIESTILWGVWSEQQNLFKHRINLLKNGHHGITSDLWSKHMTL